MQIDTSDPLFLERCRRDPMFFRRNLLLDGPDGIKPWGNFIAPFQVECFEACDPALKYVARTSNQKPKWSQFYWQRGRGSSKTTDLGSNAVWLMMFSAIRLDMVLVAGDQDQALFMRQQIEEIVGFNPWLADHIDVQKKKIVGRHTGTVLESKTSDRNTSFGATPHVTFADEWTHWTQEGFWNSIYSSYAKRADKRGVIFIGCNAGEGRDWKWNARENFRTSPRWYFSAPDGAAPWYSEENLQEQKKGMNRAEYDRLWNNRWQDSAGGFVTLDEADACINPNLAPISGTEQEGWSYVAAVDYAEKNDRTVGVVVHQYGDKIVVDRMDVIDPKAWGLKSVPLSWVENWMRDVNDKFGGEYGSVEFVVDKWQLLSTIQRLREEGYFIHEFEFKSGIGNYEIGLILRQLILHKRVEWYPDCGQILDQDGVPFMPDERDDLSTELAALEKKELSAGSRWRFQHHAGGHDDRAFALGACCRQIITNTGGLEEWQLVPPTPMGHFNLNLR